jgi:hypothetical protein
MRQDCTLGVWVRTASVCPRFLKQLLSWLRRPGSTGARRGSSSRGSSDRPDQIELAVSLTDASPMTTVRVKSAHDRGEGFSRALTVLFKRATRPAFSA